MKRLLCCATAAAVRPAAFGAGRHARAGAAASAMDPSGAGRGRAASLPSARRAPPVLLVSIQHIRPALGW